MATKTKLVVSCTATGAMCLHFFYVMLALFLLFHRYERVSKKKDTLCVFSAFKATHRFFILLFVVVLYIRFVVVVLN